MKRDVREEESSLYVIFSAEPFHTCLLDHGMILNKVIQMGFQKFGGAHSNPIADLTFCDNLISWTMFSLYLSAPLMLDLALCLVMYGKRNVDRGKIMTVLSQGLT